MTDPTCLIEEAIEILREQGRHVLADEVEQVTRERDEARRLLGHARVTLIGIAGATARAWELPRNEFIDEFLPWAQSRARDTAAKTAIHAPSVDGEPS